MNQRTEQPDVASEGHPRLAVEWVCAIILGGIVFFWSSAKFPPFLNPWAAASGLMIRSAMETFAGRTPAVVDTGERSTMLFGVLAGFVIGPSIFLLAWRKIRLGGLPQSFIASLLFVAGGAVTLAAVIPSVPEAVRLQVRSARGEEERAAQAVKGNLMNGLDAIAVDARAYWILPGTKRGGNGSYTGYKIPGRLKGDAEMSFEMAACETRKIRFNGSAAAFGGSSVALELDSTKSRFTYEGVFRP